jgi:2-succinyl-6-hydroxy-2,4-cyclohexadiene-1-carboxylate synthase
LASPNDVVLLHGFAGTSRTWDGVLAHLRAGRRHTLALDLPGHGSEADGPRPISFASCVEHVLARAPKSFTLCGYSLGGRVALHVALAAPVRVARLLLVSTSPGIPDDAERARRRASDHRLADELERAPFAHFIEHWNAQPLLADDPPEVGALAREDQRRNRPDALAAALRGIGVGEMQPLWDRLPALRMPVDVLAGDRDRKFRQSGQQMVDLLPDARLVLVRGAHRLPLENPAAVAMQLATSHETVT